VGLIQAVNRNLLFSLQNFKQLGRETGAEKPALLGKCLNTCLILTEVNRTQGTAGTARRNQNIGPSSSASCFCQWATRNTWQQDGGTLQLGDNLALSHTQDVILISRSESW